MRKFQKAVVALASAAMILGTVGMAGAAPRYATPGTCVSRAKFVMDFDIAAGIAPVTPATADFTDVPSSSPYFGYIEAAVKAGIIAGVGGGLFDPTGCLTRAQIAKIEVLAAGDGAAALALMTKPTSFGDNSSIPAWARGYVAEAVTLGLVHGYPNGTYQPNASMTSTDEGFFIAQYKTVAASGSFTLSATTMDAAVGQSVTLSSTSTSPVTYSVGTTGAIVAGAIFVGSTPGNYTVTGQNASGTKATLKISVYGAAAGLKVNIPAGIVANGATTESVGVDVVDANGNIVANNTDAISLSVAGTPHVLTSEVSPTVAAVAGVATFTFTAGTVAGATDNLTATDGALTATASATSLAQTPTSISVTMPKSLSANSQTSANATATVLDQTGSPILSTTPIALSATISGPATLSSQGATTATSVYTGNGTPTPSALGTFTLYSVQAGTGTVTLTVTGTGLTSGIGTLSAVIAGAPAQVALTPPGTASFTQDNGAQGLTYTFQVEDQSGNPVGDSLFTPVVTVLNASAQAALGTNSLTYNPTTGAGSVTVYDPSVITADAGNYTVQVSDNAKAITASSALNFTETAGAANKLKVTSPSDQGGSPSYISVASPSQAIAVQLEDPYGNPVHTSGVTVNYAAVGPNAAHVTVVASAMTNASGLASVTASVLPQTGPAGQYQVHASSGLLTADDAYFDVQSTIAQTVTVSLEDLTTSSHTQGTSGDTVAFTITAKDSFSNAVLSNDSVKVTFSGAATFGTPSLGTVNPDGSWNIPLTSGTATVDAMALTAGSVTPTATDESVAATPSGSSPFSVMAGAPVGWALFNAQGQQLTPANKLTVTGGTPVEVFAKPVDGHGNPAVLTITTPLTLTDGNGGAFRPTSNGSDIAAPLSENAGTSAVTLWYVNSTSGTYDVSGDAT